jgi:hypothetical protein
MRQEVAELNHEFAGNKGILAQIGQQYKALSKNDALFGNEVNIGKDGSLTFAPNDVISHQLRDASAKAAKELKALHKLERKMGKDDGEGRVKHRKSDEISMDKMMKQFTKTQQSMEHEEHLLAAAHMNPQGEAITPGKGYTAAQRSNMQNLVDTSLAQSEKPIETAPTKYVSSGDFNGYVSMTPDEYTNQNNALLKFYGLH